MLEKVGQTRLVVDEVACQQAPAPAPIRAPVCGLRLLKPHRDHTSTTSGGIHARDEPHGSVKAAWPDLLNLSARKDMYPGFTGD
jgi:hypothetical protein